MKTRTLAAAAIGMLVPQVALGQITTASTPVCQSTDACPWSFPYTAAESPVKVLSTYAEEGDWSKLQGYAAEQLKLFADTNAGFAQKLASFSKTPVGLVWVGLKDGKPILNRLLVKRRLAPELSTRLPGVHEVTDVFFSNSPGATLKSIYESVPVADPLLAQLPDVIARIGLPAFLAKSLGPTHADVPAEKIVYVSLYRTRLPMARADLGVKSVAFTPITAKGFESKLADLNQKLQLREARHSDCAKALGTELSTRLGKLAIGEASCADDAAKCLVLLKGELVEASRAVLETPTCRNEAPSGAGYDPPLKVEADFTALVNSLGAQEVIGTWKLTNRPRTRLSFGLLTSLRLGAASLDEKRVKVEQGRIVEAPMDRALTMVSLNIHPFPYDPEVIRMQASERFRLFVGVVTSPDFGFGGGLAIGLVRGLGVNLGGAWLFSDTVKDGEKIGNPPTAANANDPFRARLARTAFAGLSYTFK